MRNRIVVIVLGEIDGFFFRHPQMLVLKAFIVVHLVGKVVKNFGIKELPSRATWRAVSELWRAM